MSITNIHNEEFVLKLQQFVNKFIENCSPLIFTEKIKVFYIDRFDNDVEQFQNIGFITQYFENDTLCERLMIYQNGENKLYILLPNKSNDIAIQALNLIATEHFLLNYNEIYSYLYNVVSIPLNTKNILEKIENQINIYKVNK